VWKGEGLKTRRRRKGPQPKKQPEVKGETEIAKNMDESKIALGGKVVGKKTLLTNEKGENQEKNRHRESLNRKVKTPARPAPWV